jgi:hypothetical protein
MAMKKLFYIILLTILSNTLYASHILGGGISWEQIGIDTFKITATVYRDCNGVNLSATPVTAFSNCGSMRLNTKRNGGEDITPVCKDQCSKCDYPGCSFRYGIEKYELTTIFITTQWRKNGCCDVTLTWSDCCRPTNYSTFYIAVSTSTPVYIEAKMPICDTINPINSPKWINEPPLITCLGSDLIYNLSAEKQNPNDSLVYSFEEPRTSVSAKIFWTNNYSYDKPMYYLGFPKTGLKFPRGIHLDSLTGVFMVKPMKTEFTTLTYKVEIYRNGVYKGEMIRESPFIIKKCADNNPPVLSGINCSIGKPENFEVNFCANSMNVFEICVSDQDKNDTVTYSYSTDIKGAHIEYDEQEQFPKITFKWKPELGDTGKTFSLLVKANDNVCPINGTTSRVYKIKVVNQVNYKVGSFSDSCNNGNFYLKSFDSSKIKCVTWQHKGKSISPCLDSPIKDTVTFNFKKPGLKHIRLTIPTLSGCKIVDSIPLKTSQTLTYFSGLRDTTVCARDSIEFKAVLHNPIGPASISWSTGFKTNNLSSAQKIGLGYNDSLVVVSYKDSFCSSSDSTYITVNKPHILSFAKNIKICHADSDTFKFEQKYYAKDLDSTATYTWLDSIGNLIESTSNPYFIFPYNGQYTFKSTNGFGCTEIDTIQYTLFDPIEDFYLTDSLLCNKALDTLKANKVKEGHLNWFKAFGSGFAIATDTNLLVQKIKDTTKYRLEYVNRETGCKAQKIVAAYPVLPDAPKFVIVDSMCAYDTFTVSTHLSNPTWAFDSVVTTGHLQIVPIDYGYNDSLMPITFTGIDSNNCKVASIVNLKIEETPIAKIWSADTLLLNEVFYPRPTVDQKHNDSFYWEFGDPVFMTFNDYQPQVSFDTLGSFKVKLTVTNKDNGCATSTIKAKDIIVQRFPTHLDEINTDLSIYPNPTSSQLILKSTTEIERVSLHSIDGKLLFESKTNDVSYHIDMQSFKQGIYLLKVGNKQGNEIHIIKKI